MTEQELDALVMALTEQCAREHTYDSLYDEAATAITTLRAQLAEARAERDAIIVARDMMGRLWEKEKAHADRAEFNAAQLTVMVGEDAVEQIEAAVAAAIRAAKVEAWKESEVATLGLATGRECQLAILALIEREGGE